jgi:hypothetical protein
MAYNRANFLEKVIAIQNVYSEHHDRGATDTWIYKNLIWPNYYISLRTFYNYLAIPAVRELKAIGKS